MRKTPHANACSVLELHCSGELREWGIMEGCCEWAKIGMKGLRGATVGLLSGGFVAGVVAVGFGIAIQLTAEGDAGCFTSTEAYLFDLPFIVWFFVGIAMFAAPGCIVTGAVAALCRPMVCRLTAGFAGGLLPTAFFSYQLWLCDDVPRNWPDWPYNFLTIGGGSLVGALVAGAVVSGRNQTSGRSLSATQLSDTTHFSKGSCPGGAQPANTRPAPSRRSPAAR